MSQMNFGWDGGEEAVSPALPAARRLSERLGRLARRRVFLGGSSWKYPGWLGQVYDPARYAYRGQFAQSRFDRDCLTEYAGVFPTVCGDFAFYQFPSPPFWERLFAQVPDGFLMGLKVCEEVTIERYPNLPRYGQRAGHVNPDFMNPEPVLDRLLDPLEPYRDKLGPLIFQFAVLREGPRSQASYFTERLDRMLAELPTDRYRFAVEARNRNFLEPPHAYLDCLRRRGVAHCLNHWTDMPAVKEQMTLPGVFTAPFTVARFLLKPGRTYQEAVENFAPYDRLRDPYPEGRRGLTDLIEHALREDRELFAFVNNRFEGNAVQTIDLAVEAARI